MALGTGLADVAKHANLVVDSKKCPFLNIPTELRLAIYEYALRDGPAITIGTAELVGKHADIVHRL